MDQTIRVTGEKESEVRIKLELVEKELKDRIRKVWNISDPIYQEIFFVVFTMKDRLGEFDAEQGLILLSEDLIYQDFSLLKNVFLHEAAHAIDFALNGYGGGAHTPKFREYCALIGVEDGFDKARIKHKLDEDVKIKERMAKLMAMSSSPFENEAMIALSKARKLLLENSEALKEQNDKEDKIYDVNLYEAGRLPYYLNRLAQFVGKATGVFIVKVLGTDKGTAIRAYGALEEVEAALYLFGDLLSALDEETKKLIGYVESQGYEYVLLTTDRCYLKKESPHMYEFYAWCNIDMDSLCNDYDLDEVLKKTIKLEIRYNKKEDSVGLIERLGAFFYEKHDDSLNIEVSNIDTSKGHGIETMLHYYGLDVDDSYCFGDGANNLEMFQTVGHPIAMKNAIPMIYHHASIICEDVLHDGVAKELKRLF